MFKIGFFQEEETKKTAEVTNPEREDAAAPRRSLVQVRFPESGRSLAYYNDRFDLKIGNLVYVEGSMEGQRGRVEEISYNFKIKTADYKKVIAFVDTEVHGKFYSAGSHFVTFDRNVISAEKIRGWFLAPVAEEDEFITATDDESFTLDAPEGMGIAPKIAERGYTYYLENRVKYLCLDGTKGYAIVEGTEPYEVEFTYDERKISGLTCSCFCTYHCKHEFAVMLQLEEILKWMEEERRLLSPESGYLAAICKGTLFATAIADKKKGSIEL